MANTILSYLGLLGKGALGELFKSLDMGDDDKTREIFKKLLRHIAVTRAAGLSNERRARLARLLSEAASSVAQELKTEEPKQ